MIYDHLTIRRDILQQYFVRNGEVYAFGNSERIMDEDTRIQVMMATFISEEARMAASKSEVLVDEIMDRLIFAYGINGDRNELVQNKMVWKIVDSEGNIGDTVHIEEEYIDDTLTGTRYSLLTGPNKEMGRSVLRYLARQRGFDISELDATIDTDNFRENHMSKISIDFKKVQVLNERPISSVNESRYAMNLDSDTGLNSSEQKTPYWINPKRNLINNVVEPQPVVAPAIDPLATPAPSVAANNIANNPGGSSFSQVPTSVPNSVPEPASESALGPIPAPAPAPGPVVIPKPATVSFNLDNMPNPVPSVQAVEVENDDMLNLVRSASVTDFNFNYAYERLGLAEEASDIQSIETWKETIRRFYPRYCEALKLAQDGYREALLKGNQEDMRDWQEALDYLKSDEFFNLLPRPEKTSARSAS